MLVDSHCHLNFPELITDLKSVVKNAENNNVKYLLTVNTRLQDMDDLLQICSQYSNIFCSVGVHPCDAKTLPISGMDENAQIWNESNLFDAIFQYASYPRVVAVGETGLDYYYEKTHQDWQQKSFGVHLSVASKLNLPVIVHTRDADEDTINIIKNAPSTKGVFHCFTGDLVLAKKALDLGYYISFSGIITFKNAEILRDVVRFVPMDRLLVETDSPYLAPVPHRGQPNQPEWVRFVAEKVSNIKNIALHEVETLTTRNFFNLFDKAKNCLEVSFNTT